MIVDIINHISNTLSVKGEEYQESVISLLPRGDWLSQIVIKAHRAQRAVSDEKLRDELLDTACYCILLLDKLEHETPQKTIPSTTSDEGSVPALEDMVYTDDDNTHHTGKRK